MNSSSAPSKTDRYISFAGIECDANAKRCVAHIRRLAQGPAGNAFWDKFLDKVERSNAGEPGHGDELFLVHANINTIRELFEDCADQEAMDLLEQLEMECC